MYFSIENKVCAKKYIDILERMCIFVWELSCVGDQKKQKEANDLEAKKNNMRWKSVIILIAPVFWSTLHNSVECSWEHGYGCLCSRYKLKNGIFSICSSPQTKLDFVINWRMLHVHKIYETKKIICLRLRNLLLGTICLLVHYWRR